MLAVRRRDDSGMVMVTVLSVVMLLLLLLSAALASAVSLQRQAKTGQSWNAALAAAQAGVDDYLSRLNSDGGYWVYGNASDPYTNNPSAPLPPPSNPNAAFTTWQQVPTSSGRAQFRYQVDSSKYVSQGIIKLRSTGRVGTSTRTLETTLRRDGFLDYLYFTNYETLDPAAYPNGSSPLTRAQADNQCRTWSYNGRSSDCVDINFASGDVVKGPLHTNDSLLVCGGPSFQGPTTTSWNSAAPRYRVNGSCGEPSPKFARAGDPAFKGVLALPPNNANISREVDSRFTPTPGCLYAGPTRIVLNADGTMNVNSPWTRNTAQCRTGSSVPLPANGVVYVQSVPTDSSAANYWAANAAGRPTCAANGNPIGYPQNGDVSTYPCSAGDVFVEGTLKGKLTVAAENDIYITGNLKYSNNTSNGDVLGLVANNYVQVYHPVKCTSSYRGTCYGFGDVAYPHNGTTSTFTNPQISAAILSVQHSFIVQNYTRGSQLGTLSVNGAIAQNFRGPVGLIGTSGYQKQYVYDSRLKYLSPPHFLDPVQSAFQVTTSAEPPPAFPATAP